MKRVVLLIAAVTSLFAMTQKLEVVSIEGEVGVYGSMPHSFLAIRDSNNSVYKIENYQDFNLTKLQNQMVDAKVLILNRSKIFKNVQEVQLLELKVLP